MAADTPSMNEPSIAPLPDHQSHQSHQSHGSAPQHEIPTPPTQHPSNQSDSMERTTSPNRSSSSHSPFSDESVQSTSTSSPSIYPSYLLPYLVPMSPQQRKTLGTKDTARRLAKRLLRLEARLTPSRIVARAQRRIEREEMKRSDTCLLKEACIKRELKRAKGTAVFPKTFETIDIHNDGDEEDSACEHFLITRDCEASTETSAPKTEAFAGLVIIQDRLSAMRQALAEHAKDRTLRTEPGRHSFYVDAAVSREDGITGIAVVHKTHRQDWASLWTAKGYRIYEALDQMDAEAWAVWQALQSILEKVHADRAKLEPQDPCSLAVVYSDCAWMLGRFANGRSGGGKVVQKIIAKSLELQRIGVEVHLHWVPGHTKIPGNELADLVCKKARQPVK